MTKIIKTAIAFSITFPYARVFKTSSRCYMRECTSVLKHELIFEFRKPSVDRPL